MLLIVKFICATNMYMAYSNSLFVLNLNEISIVQKELRGRAAHLVRCVHGTDLYRSAHALHVLFSVSQLYWESLWPPAKLLRCSPFLRSFIHSAVSKDCLSHLQGKDCGAGVVVWGPVLMGIYILKPSRLKRILFCESLTQPCNKCILKKSREIFVHLFQIM